MKKLLNLLLIISVSYKAFAQIEVLTQHDNNGRTGWNDQETVLNQKNVNTSSFGVLFRREVDDQIYAQPLIAQVRINGGQIRNVVFIATVNNTLYAFDADSAGKQDPYWMVNLTAPGSRVVRSPDMTGACGGDYNNFSKNIGIVGTPVIDTTSHAIYLVARSYNISTNEFAQYLHSIDIRTGQENPNSPVLIEASISGGGDGNINGVVYFDAQKNNQRPALLLIGGVVYIGFSSHCDWGPYHGWLLGYDANTLQQVMVYNDTPEGYNGGIWMSGTGPAADSLGNIFIATGNGSVGFNGDPSSPVNRSESALKLTPSGNRLAVSSYFTPMNYNDLEAADLDFGTGSIILLPHYRMLASCKDGNLYLMDGSNLGGFDALVNHSLQRINLGSNANMHAQYCYYGGSQKANVYVWSENTSLKAIPYDPVTGLFEPDQTITSGVEGPSGQTGAMMSVSSNGKLDSTAILWASYPVNCDAESGTCPGILRAFDANDITRELWNSGVVTEDDPGSFAKFNSPTVANGKVYLGTFSNQLVVYGIQSSIPDNCHSENISAGKPAYASSEANDTLKAANAFDGNYSTEWSGQPGNTAFIIVDLGKYFDLCSASLYWGKDPAGEFQIQVSYDTLHWQTLVHLIGNTAGENTFHLRGTGRYVRLIGIPQDGSSNFDLKEFEVFGKESAVKCPPPFELNAINIYENSATLQWKTYGADRFEVQYKTVMEDSWESVTVSGTSAELKKLSCGADYYFKVRSICSDSSTSDFAPTVSFSTLACDSHCGYLPSHWKSQDVGNPGLPGSACYAGGVFTLNASGADIWGNSDQFHFAYTLLEGNGSFVVHVNTMDKSNPWNKCGIMMRESLSPGSKHAFIALTSGNGVAFQYRENDFQESSNTNLTGLNYPVWLKMVKNGSVYSGYYSSDGNYWLPAGQPVNLEFGNAPFYVGLALTSHDNSQISRSLLDSFNTSGFTEIDLESFTGEISRQPSVQLYWSTSLEINAAYFLVERSADDKNFTVIDTVTAADHGKFIENYQATDDHPSDGINYYRLKIIDAVDNFSYSPLVLIRLTRSIAPLIYPNPIKDILNISQGSDPIRSVSIYDTMGKLLIRVNNIDLENTVSIPLTNQFRSFYIVEINTTTQSYRYKAIRH